jgi:hypothetical protein
MLPKQAVNCGLANLDVVTVEQIPRNLICVNSRPVIEVQEEVL